MKIVMMILGCTIEDLLTRSKSSLFMVKIVSFFKKLMISRKHIPVKTFQRKAVAEVSRIGEIGCCESRVAEQKTLMDRTVQLSNCPTDELTN